MGDLRTTTGEKLPETPRERRSRAWRIIVWLLIGSVLIFILGKVVKVRRYAPASGYATTTGYAEVRAATTGTIVAIPVTSGDYVKEGELLLKLEDGPERAAVAEARTQMQKGEAELAYRTAALAEKIRRHANQIKQTEMELQHAAKRLDLTRELHTRGLASGRQLSEDTYGVARAEEMLRDLRETDLTVEERELEVFRQEVQAKAEVMARAEAALAQRSILAPCAGRVVRYTFYVGELARPDMVLYEIFEGEVNTMKLRIPERYATRVKPGLLVEAKLGSYRTLLPTRFKGRVEVLRDVVEGDGSSNFRVVYCSLDRNNREVAPGTSVDARIHIGRSSLWRLLIEP